ncbi:MAG: hypothetical protein PHU12_00845, partial [Candidatus Aenigmarchaeota archaeon]|nr:hypothetical protein [Candidatus Aenigmarchaeota archaeon]
PSMDRPYLKTDIEDFNLFRNSMNSTGLIVAKDVRIVQEELDTMDVNKRKDIVGIATAMRPEIAEDLKFIEKTHY